MLSNNILFICPAFLLECRNLEVLLGEKFFAGNRIFFHLEEVGSFGFNFNCNIIIAEAIRYMFDLFVEVVSHCLRPLKSFKYTCLYHFISIYYNIGPKMLIIEPVIILLQSEGLFSIVYDRIALYH